MSPRVRVSAGPCGRRRPRSMQTSPLVASRLPCALPTGHDGPHEDAIGQTWHDPNPELEYALGVALAADLLRWAFTDDTKGNR
ncbi:hypothetical protein H3146_18975 [Streptomyces sp. OF3]|uniref:Uncharacterized protein n=1 Tax=Streptomyces alkaliterrae TaxID=2213162 RepID=A0A7W3WN73_9ACTN|nr:hypothetical protein [Streptomyces alkaliterrae]MBB1255423.1 hypothetical protein [Streptomyces alkaliterrae]